MDDGSLYLVVKSAYNFCNYLVRRFALFAKIICISLRFTKR